METNNLSEIEGLNRLSYVQVFVSDWDETLFQIRHREHVLLVSNAICSMIDPSFESRYSKASPDWKEYIKSINALNSRLSGLDSNGIFRSAHRFVRSVDTEKGRTAVIKSLSLSAKSFWEQYRYYLANHEELQKAGQLIEGSKELLERLTSAGRSVALITNSSKKIIDPLICKLFPSDPFVKKVFISDTSLKKKPAPDAFYILLNELDIDPARVAYIGNTIEDIEFAQNAGALGIFMNHQQIDCQKIPGGTLIFNNFEQLHQTLNLTLNGSN